jgi:hypothetical protein
MFYHLLSSMGELTGIRNAERRVAVSYSLKTRRSGWHVPPGADVEW